MAGEGLNEFSIKEPSHINVLPTIFLKFLNSNLNELYCGSQTVTTYCPHGILNDTGGKFEKTRY